jgi:hypothetical protein
MYDIEENEEDFIEYIDKNFSIIKPFYESKAELEFSSTNFAFNTNSSKSLIYITRRNNYDIEVSIM